MPYRRDDRQFGGARIGQDAESACWRERGSPTLAGRAIGTFGRGAVRVLVRALWDMRLWERDDLGECACALEVLYPPGSRLWRWIRRTKGAHGVTFATIEHRCMSVPPCRQLAIGLVERFQHTWLG